MRNGRPSLIRVGGLTDEPDHFTGLRVELDSGAAAPVDFKRDLVPASSHGQFDGLTLLDSGYFVIVQDDAVASETVAPDSLLARQQYQGVACIGFHGRIEALLCARGNTACRDCGPSR
jgi:hypothetical protein